MKNPHNPPFFQVLSSVAQRFMSFTFARISGAIALSLYALIFPVPSAQALTDQPFKDSMLITQVIPDSTLPSSSIVTFPDGNSTATLLFITGGTVSGNSLFHSFEDFSIRDEQTIQFQNSVTLDHIITRITGESISTLNGTLATQGFADFFLLNPNGIVFGPNATLDIGGSFIGSTADRLLFENGADFSAVNPQAPPLLSITTPIGLQFESDPGLIRVEGNSHQLAIDPNTLEIIQTNRPEGLQVNSGETFALLGGPVTFDGGNVTARDGRVVLGALDAGQTVALVGDALGWALADDEQLNETNSRVQDIRLSNASSVLTSGNSGGQIQLFGGKIALTEGSTLLANTVGAGNGRGINIEGIDQIILKGSVLDAITDEPIFPNLILSEVEIGATGNGGDIDLRTNRLRVVDGSQISTSTLGAGDAGTLSVVANRVTLQGGIDDFLETIDNYSPSGLFVDVLDEGSTGQGGTLNVVAERLVIHEGAVVGAGTFGLGNGGNISLDVSTLVITGEEGGSGISGIFADTEGPGRGGNIRVEGNRLRILDGGQISSTTFDTGDGGTVELKVEQITLDGFVSDVFDDLIVSSISSTVDSADGALGEGQGGTVVIHADQLQVRNGGQINVLTSGLGDGGQLTVEAGRIQLQGSNDEPTGLFVATQPNVDGDVWDGNGGDLQIVSDRLVIENGAQIVSGAFSDGEAGSLTVTTRELIVQGQTDRARSGLLANAIFGSGEGGNVRVNADTVRIMDGGTLNASNFFSGNAGVPAGTGPAGSIIVQADDIVLNNGGLISTSTNVGDKGNIQIEGDRLLLLDQSRIITDANSADGGNIDIAADVVVAIANSDITANANLGRGGRITITAQALLGSEFRDRLTPLSDITATSNLGPEFNGIVQINTPDSEVQPDAGSLPERTIDIDQVIAQSCIRPMGRGQFLITGRGGLPPATLAPSSFGFETYSMPSPNELPPDTDSGTADITPLPLSPSLVSLMIRSHDAINSPGRRRQERCPGQ